MFVILSWFERFHCFFVRVPNPKASELKEELTLSCNFMRTLEKLMNNMKIVCCSITSLKTQIDFIYVELVA